MPKDGKTLLIVDDSTIIIVRLMRLLEELKNIHSILHARSYTDACSLLGDKRPDIILLDINLPDKSGIELLRLIKKDHTDSIVIMLSNQTSLHYKAVCKMIGSDYFMDKSTDFEQIPALIETL